jgi:hypothetical protein
MKKPLSILLLAVLFAFSASAANLTVEIQDAAGDRLSSQLTLEQDGTTVADSSGFLDVEINNGENYTLIQQIDSAPDVTVYNFSITQDLDLRPTVYTDQNPEQQFLTDTGPLYYISQDFGFSKAEIEASRNQPDRIARCTSIDGNCTEWDVQNTSQYQSSYSGSTFRYNVTSFSGYTTGNTAPLPQIENLQIYNVTDAQDPRTGGNLVTEGLNSTFTVDQKGSTEYRFSFNVSNQGSEPWALTSGDVLEHRGLNQSWSINESEDIYYSTNGSTYEGGTFSGGEVEWNTGSGGEVATGSSLEAGYLVNITQDSTNTFNQIFNASTGSGTSDQDYHDLKTLIYGYLDVDLDFPANDSVLQNNRVFTLNGTATCVDGSCGHITAEPRQNSTTSQEPFTGSEFNVLAENSTCTDLLEGQSCTVEWDVNATADANTFHQLDFQASSNYGEVQDQDTRDAVVEVRDILMINLDWNVVDFGVLDPGENEQPAERNQQGYNLTVEEDSNPVDQLWVKASPLVSEQDSSYTIGPGNMTYTEQNEYSDTPNFTSNFSLMYMDLARGTTKNLHYWLNVPYGITSGGYTGTITFKANQTQQ